MNYYEKSDHEINCLVDKELFLSGGSQPAMFKLDNPADWGKLLEDNKIRLNWWPATDEDDVGYWGASTGIQWQNGNHETKPGRAISICYLKMKEANNG